jgi:hypothetical protein
MPRYDTFIVTKTVSHYRRHGVQGDSLEKLQDELEPEQEEGGEAQERNER